MKRKKRTREQRLKAYKQRVEASFLKFMVGKETEDIFPESNKRALENLIRAGLLEP